MMTRENRDINKDFDYNNIKLHLMIKITVILSTALLAASVVGKHHADPKKWPSIKTHTTFKADMSLPFLEETDSGFSVSAQILVDSDRN
jgi:FlaG/FlaF family flagellin (archaellin)